MKRLAGPMVGRIREINVKEGQMITEDGRVFIVKDMKMENIATDAPDIFEEICIKADGRTEEDEPPWMICGGEGFGR